MTVHCCLLDKQCRTYGAPARLHIDTERSHYVLALSRNAKVQKSGTHWREGIWVWFDRRKKPMTKT